MRWYYCSRCPLPVAVDGETKLRRNPFDVRVNEIYALAFGVHLMRDQCRRGHSRSQECFVFSNAISTSSFCVQYTHLSCEWVLRPLFLLDFTEWDIYYPRRVRSRNRKIEPKRIIHFWTFLPLFHSIRFAARSLISSPRWMRMGKVKVMSDTATSASAQPLLCQSNVIRPFRWSKR